MESVQLGAQKQIKNGMGKNAFVKPDLDYLRVFVQNVHKIRTQWLTEQLANVLHQLTLGIKALSNVMLVP
jgi:hypothetical protein